MKEYQERNDTINITAHLEQNSNTTHLAGCMRGMSGVSTHRSSESHCHDTATSGPTGQSTTMLTFRPLFIYDWNNAATAAAALRRISWHAA